MVILIPAYNPDERLLGLIAQLKERFSRIVLVDDGSMMGREVLAQAEGMVEKLLVHPVNRGKGAALKTGFAYIGSEDVITADSDGQHRPEDIARVADALARHRGGIVLGSRAFVGKVPLRSRFGNFWTRWLFFLMTRIWVRDTQTGLRGIPAELVSRIAAIPGERYEYEMAMLADARHHLSRPLEVPIATIYLANNATSHFHPVRDALCIYRTLLQFCLSSVLGFLLDNAVYAAVIYALAGGGLKRRAYTLIALAAARLVSSNFNYLYNRFVVFRRRKVNSSGAHTSYLSYWGLVLVIGACSYGLTEGLSAVFDIKGVAITIIKIMVDAVLFITSYQVQKKLIFRQKI